jgi:hypothetical protein
MLLASTLLSLGLIVSGARGNEAAPAPPRPRVPPVAGKGIQEVKLLVQVDDKAKVARLQVPVNLLSDPPPGAPPAPPPPRRGADAGALGVPTIVAGLALSLAVASGGLWLVRRRWGRPLAILVVVSLFAAGTAAVWADLGPRPLGPRPPPPAPPVPAALPALKLPAGVELSDKLILESVPPDDHVTLIVPKSAGAEEKRPAPPEKRER